MTKILVLPFLYNQTNRRVTVDAENEVLKNYE